MLKQLLILLHNNPNILSKRGYFYVQFFIIPCTQKLNRTYTRHFEDVRYVLCTFNLRLVPKGGLIFSNFCMLLFFAFYLTIANFQMKTCGIVFQVNPSNTRKFSESLSNFCYKIYYQRGTKKPIVYCFHQNWHQSVLVIEVRNCTPFSDYSS